ncbi:hypothetical protein GALMADRAFT_230461 [Galerina marginata CBS 339.88]|uniref:Uncharacterized protein n=1 Tax=Galerina marginata (strain CBS 339.88) TaxID=685588 RepID=A0A067SFS3_GALM3|nr:hypothetical protein GALMADRAFT_230461 [Galerina marginata CBS 339.88]
MSAISSQAGPSITGVVSAAFTPSSAHFSSSAFTPSSIFTVSTTFRPSSTKPLSSAVRTSLRFPSSVVALSTSLPLPSQSVILAAGGQASKSNSGLNAGEIAAIAACSLIIFLGLIMCILFFFFRRRQHRQSGYQSGPPPRAIGSMEKYREDGSQYAPQRSSYFGHRKSSSSETRGTAPLLMFHSRTNSDDDREAQTYHERPMSPFINGDDEMVNIPPRSAVSYGNTAPFAQSQENNLDSVSLLPSTQPTLRPTSLPPLIIPEQAPPPSTVPEQAPPSRRPSRGKQSVRNSRRASNVVDAGYDSDDSASLYSQASASTLVPSSKSLSATWQSVNEPSLHRSLPPTTVPLPSIPQSPSNIGAGPEFDQRTPIKQLLPPGLRQEEEEQAELQREHTAFVAQLLKSRQRNSRNPVPPTRSSSTVSHIERKDSIKPVFPLSEEDGSRSRSRRGRLTRDIPPAMPPSRQPSFDSF